jgi:hypothetical protein
MRILIASMMMKTKKKKKSLMRRRSLSWKRGVTDALLALLCVGAVVVQASKCWLKEKKKKRDREDDLAGLGTKKKKSKRNKD